MELRNWYLRKSEGNVVAGGNVYNNSRYSDGMFITTDPIVSLSVNSQDKCLEIVTYSGSHYKADFVAISCEADDLKKNRVSLRFLKTSRAFVDEAVFLAKEYEQKFIKTLDMELLNGDFYIELSATAINRAYFKYDDQVCKVQSWCHVGMLIDSYLYTIDGIVDFRHYEFGFNGFSTYHISDTIKRLVVKNIHTLPMQIDNWVYPAGQTIVTCVTEKNHQEGLISPDCVNGKNIFSLGSN